MRNGILAFIACIAIGSTAFAAPHSLPDQLGALPNGFGVNIHFTDPKPGEMKMLAEAGFRWVRMDFGWGATEREKGQYEFSAYERLMKALDVHHIRPIFILDYSNRFYDDDLSPHTDEGRAAFAKWAAAAAVHFKGRGVVWEMYNEPNISFWRPKPNVNDYAKLALVVGKALREAAPDEIYVGPACSTMDFKFLEECFKAGCLEYWSAVSVHPYRQKNPETVAEDYGKLRELIAEYAPAGKTVPILSGEWGYSSAWKSFDEDKQGRYLSRELLTNVTSGIPISIWYDWHDDGTNPKESEHHFGTVHFQEHPNGEALYDLKPAYTAMRAMSTALAGCKFSKRLDTGNDADWIMLFDGPSGPRIAAWTTSQTHDVTVPIDRRTFHVTDYLGEKQPDVSAVNGGASIKLTDAPQYLVPISVH